MSSVARDLPPPRFPDGVDGWTYLRDCYHGGWSADGRRGCTRTRPCNECGACYRRWATVYNPVAFAVTYLSHLFRKYPDPLTGEPVWSFCDLHLGMADVGTQWAVPGPHRDIVIGPRDAAKSIWWIVLVVWAMAHGHRRFPLVFSWTREQVIIQLADVREALESPLLLADFPELEPRTTRGSRNTMHYVTLSGASIMGRGLKDSVLGARAPKGARPDCIVWDDADPEQSKHSPRVKRELLDKLSMILPMNLDAAVLIVGTTPMPGCITHDGVRRLQGKPGVLPDRGQWVDRQRFRAHHWPAILDEGTPMARSLWPEKWSLARLRRMLRDDPDGYDRDYACDPGAAVALRLWTPEGYRYAQGHTVERRGLSIDGAVTRKATSDLTAITLGGVPLSDPRKVVIEHAEQGRIRGLELRERIWEYSKLYPRTLKVVMIETNNGGDRWREVLEPFPPGIEEIIEYTVGGSKRQRIEGLHRHYDRGAVLHAKRLPELEDQQCAWDPTATEDDLLDAEAGLVRWALTGWPGDGPPPVIEPEAPPRPPTGHRGLRSVPTRRTR